MSRWGALVPTAPLELAGQRLQLPARPGGGHRSCTDVQHIRPAAAPLTADSAGVKALAHHGDVAHCGCAEEPQPVADSLAQSAARRKVILPLSTLLVTRCCEVIVQGEKCS